MPFFEFQGVLRDKKKEVQPLNAALASVMTETKKNSLALLLI